MGEASRVSGVAVQNDGPSERTGPFALLRKLDDAVHAIEQTVVVTFLSAMTIMVFLDVVDRRLTSPDSKIGALAARLFGIEDEASRAWLDGTFAPIFGALVGFALLCFAVHTVRSAKEDVEGFDARTLLVAVGVTTGLVVLGYLMTWRAEEVNEWGDTVLQRQFPSKYIYLLLYACVAVPLGLRAIRKGEEVGKRLGALLAGGASLAYFALTYFPDEYSWSLEVSGIMLLWVGALGASVCAYGGKHIRLEALQKTVPPKLHKWVVALGFWITALFAGLMALFGWTYLQGQIEFGAVFEQTQIPDAVATTAIPLAFALTALRFIAAGVSALMGGEYGVAKTNELDAAKAARSDSDSDGSGSDSAEEQE